MANKTAEYADEIDKLSERTGINREELQRWKYAASQSGADIGKLETGIKTLSGVMDDALNGSQKAIEAFDALGISIDELREKPQEEIFEKVMASLADMEQGATRNALGADLLGRSYTELLPLLNAGSKGIQELKDRADELGIVMSEDAIKANVEFGDTIQDIKESLGGMVRGMTNSLMPMLLQFVKFIVANMPAIQKVLEGIFNGLGSSVAEVLPFLMELIQDVLPEVITLFSDIASGVLPPLIRLFMDIVRTILPPLLQIFNTLVSSLLPPLIDLLRIVIDKILPPFIKLFGEVISVVLPPLLDLFSQVIDRILPPLIALFEQIIDKIMPILIEMFTLFTELVLPPLMEVFDEIIKEILPPLLDLFNELAAVILPIFMDAFAALQPVIEPAMKALAAIIKTVLALIKGDWEGVWEALKEYFINIWNAIVKAFEGIGKVFSSVFEGLKKAVLAIWNGLVDGIKSAINFILGGINTFIRALNSIKIPDWVPGVGGMSLNVKEIPLLAAGGEITQAGKAIVGEAGPELLELPQGAKVKPLSYQGEGIDYDRLETIVYTSFFDAFMDVMKALGKGEITINIDGKILARELIPRIIAENQRMGVATT